MKRNEKPSRLAKPVGGTIFVCAMIVAALAIALCLSFIPVFGIGNIPAHAEWSFPVGMIFIAVGAFMAFRAIFIVHVMSNVDSESLVKNDIYAWTRNPVHTGALFVSTGILVTTGNLFAFIFPFIFWGLLTIVIKETEEKYLAARYSTEFAKYCDSVNRFIPWLPEKQSENEHYRKMLRLAAMGLVVSAMLVIIVSRAISALSGKMTYEAILGLKKSMLKDNVDNMMAYMDAYLDDLLAAKPDMTGEEQQKAAFEAAHLKIHSETHSDGTYMWVHRVLDYAGGDDYAIRLIHPNLKDTEGTLLSTNVVNEMGMKAYEIELQGVLEHGYIYQNYAFKKLDSNAVSEKITYSALYRRLDWIICMGVNIEDLYHYRTQAQDKLGVYQNVILFSMSIIWTAFLLAVFYFYRKNRVAVYETANRELSTKLNVDPLTGAGSRMYGEKCLNEAFDDYKDGKEYILLLILDIDFFKQFNDNYGHEMGDKVLKSFVASLKSSTRSNDAVIRWGGDEFIIILQNVPPKYQPETANRILNNIRNISIPELGDRKITASMGFAYFAPGDEDVKSALARADVALYKAKEAGRNQWKLYED